MLPVSEMAENKFILLSNYHMDSLRWTLLSLIIQAFQQIQSQEFRTIIAFHFSSVKCAALILNQPV